MLSIKKQGQFFPLLKQLLVVFVLSLLFACSRFDVAAFTHDSSFTKVVRMGGSFQHQVFESRLSHSFTVAPTCCDRQLLHIYIEGDGRPWISPGHIARDPTPVNPLMLRLMALDPAPAIYVGRPCYFQLMDDYCSPEWWTHKRYAERIVSSIDHVIQQYAIGYDGVVLLGHSGGGTLAMLLAQRRQDVQALVTLAGNLDIEQWAKLHSYSSLKGSLNPAMETPLPESILQQHFLGKNDDNITPIVLRNTIEKQAAAQLYLLDNVDHLDGWVQRWPTLLQALKQELTLEQTRGDSDALNLGD